MANTYGDDPRALDTLSHLAQHAKQYDYYAALRLLECYFQEQPRLGQSHKAHEDRVRLGQEPSNLFAPSTLFSCENEADNYWHIQVLFFGLFGPNGALPHHLTEYVRERRRKEINDQATLAFFNLFHHRLLSFFYRAWANKEPTVERDRPYADQFDRYIGSLSGIGLPELQHRDLMPDDSKRHFAAYLGGKHRHVQGLITIIKNFFHIPLLIHEFTGEWLAIPSESQSCLGRPLGAQLGVDAIAGRYSWQVQFKFTIELGPMSLSEYESFLPNQANLKLLSAVVRNYLGDELSWSVNLVLKKEQIPPISLGTYGQLGWTTWLKAKYPTQDAKDLFINNQQFVGV